MSIILSWETPPELYDAMLSASVAELVRVFPGTDQQQIVTSNLPWGFYEDEGNSDPAVQYEIQYRNRNSSAGVRIFDYDIRRWVRPADSCRIDFSFRRPDSSPWSGRRVKLLDLPGHHWIRDLWMNVEGKAHVILGYGESCRLEVEGMMEALEFVTPHSRRVEWQDLQDLGSWVRMDERSIR